MNKLQNIILEIIYKISNTEGVFDFGDDTLYGLKNYIARHSLANDEYYVSERAFSLFREYGFTVPFQRAKLSKLKPYFTYEHPVPVSITAAFIRNSSRTLEEISTILEFADCVTLVTKEEDKHLLELHRHVMPTEWIYLKSSNFARYESAGIKMRKEKIRMKGRLVR